MSLFIMCSDALGYNWSVQPKDYLNPPYPIFATLGEYRTINRFHSGVDVFGVVGDEVHAIEEGEVRRLDENGNTDNEGVQVGNFLFIHINIDRNIKEKLETGEKVTCKSNDLIGTIKSISHPHLHLTEKDTTGSNYINPLREGGLSGYVDSKPTGMPVVGDAFWFYKNDSEERFNDKNIDAFVINNKVDILARAYDRQIEGMGSQNVGIYKISYQVRNEFSQDPLLDICNIKFDEVPVELYRKASNVYYTALSNQSTYYYWVTNKIDSNNYWDTTQHPDGKYTVSVLVWDIAGNGGDVAGSKRAASQKVIINNKRPVIKSISVADNSDE